MAGPVPPYLSTQTAAQTAFTVPFGLLTLVNSKIAAATAAGEFNTTVDCSLFVTEDVSNLRIYLDSLGYKVDFAKDTNNKSLNIDWGKFLDDATDATVVYQGTSPWVVSGTVTANQGTSPWVVSGTIATSPDVNVHDGTGNPIGSTAGALNVSVTDFPATVEVTQGTTPWTVDGTIIADQGTSPWITSVSNFPAVQAVSQSGAWMTGRTWALSSGTDSVNVGNFPATVAVTQSTSPWVVSGTVNATQLGTWTVQQGTPPWSVSVTNFPATQPVSGTVTALQGTSPWVVSGTVTTSPDVNIHDSAGNGLSSTGTSLDANITNFPATVAVTQSTSPWVVSGTVTANAGTGNFTVVQATGTNLHAVIDSGNVAASQSGVWSVGRTWALSSGTDSVGAVQSGSWTVAGTGNFTVVQPTGTNLHTVLDSGTLTSITNALPAGTNVIGHVITDSGSTTAVTGNVTVIQPTGTNLHTVVDSGAITANIGTTGGLALDATLTNSTQKTQIVQGGNTAVVDAAGDVQVDVNNFPATVAVTQSTSPWVVSGTVTANAGTGNFTVVQPTGTNLHTVLDSGTLTSITNALPAGTNVIGHVITDSGSTTAVTGNITVVQPTGTNLHTVVDSGTIAATQSGAWTTGRTWTLASGTDSVSAVQSGAWTVQPGNTPNTSPWLIEQRAPGTLTSYSAATLGLVAAATPTDIFTLYGSGTKTIRVTRVEISATQNTAAIRDIVLIKRSAANTGGTSTAPTIVPYDSNNAVATATVLAYTANPASLGASVGNVRTAKVDIPATNLVGNTDRIAWTFGDRPSQAVVLRGTSQGMAINLNSVTSSNNSFNINIEWTEE